MKKAKIKLDGRRLSSQKTTTFQHDPAVVSVLRQIKDRVEGLQLTGKARDNEALSFILGAGCGMLAVGDKRGNTCLKLGGLMVSIQGYAAVETILAREDGREQEGKSDAAPAGSGGPGDNNDHGKNGERKRP